MFTGMLWAVRKYPSFLSQMPLTSTDKENFSICTIIPKLYVSLFPHLPHKSVFIFQLSTQNYLEIFLYLTNTICHSLKMLWYTTAFLSINFNPFLLLGNCRNTTFSKFSHFCVFPPLLFYITYTEIHHFWKNFEHYR